MAEDYFSFTQKIFDPLKAQGKAEALKGIRVLDLSHMIFGPMAAKFLGQFGAEVIKVEVPYLGDHWRGATYWGKYWKHSNPLWNFINHSKYFVGIDVKKAKGKDLILKLAEMSDVVIENFTSGTVEAWGIGYTQVRKKNPGVIYAGLSTFGQYGPFRFFPGWDLLAQGASGMLSTTGHPKTDRYFKIPDFYGDFLPGFYAAMLILMALIHRQKTGEGQYLDVSQAEILMRGLFHFTYQSVTKKELGRTGNVDPTMIPSGIFKTRDQKFIALAIATDQQWTQLCKAMNRMDLLKEENFKKALIRQQPENAEKLNNLVNEWIRSKDEKDLIQVGRQYGFAISAVMDDLQICNDAWRRELGSVIAYQDEMYKKLILSGPSAMLSKTPARIKWLIRPLGYHNRYVFKKLLGLSEKMIKELEKDRVVGYWDYRVGQRPPAYYNLDQDSLFHYSGGEDH
jgi:crotonobetainyl-CoA:carnitine CoA-transferase CaiB-like acyl-CoA transferase